MPERLPVTRAALRRELFVNAATKPVAVTVGAAVAVDGFLLGALWLLPVAAVLYLALAATTLFDPDEAARRARDVRARAARGRRRTPARPGAGARRARRPRAGRGPAHRARDRRLGAALHGGLDRGRGAHGRDGADRPPRRRSSTTSPTSSPPRCASGSTRCGASAAGATRRRVRGMEHLIASLGVVHGQLVRMSVTDDARLQEELVGQVRDLRERVDAVADGMREAVAQLRDPAAYAGSRRHAARRAGATGRRAGSSEQISSPAA